MGAAIIAGITALLGVLLGGGLRAKEAAEARRVEAAGVLSALCAEVEAINRLANHRRFLDAFEIHRALNADLVARGLGESPGEWLVLDLTQNYFATYEALLPKLGLLDPYFVDRITRFYTYAKAVSENYRSTSVWQGGVTANSAAEALNNDIDLLRTMHILGLHIASFRTIDAPPGVKNPFEEAQQLIEAPAAPEEIGQEPPPTGLPKGDAAAT